MLTGSMVEHLTEVADGAFDVAEVVLVDARAHGKQRAGRLRLLLLLSKLLEHPSQIREAAGRASQPVQRLLRQLVHRIFVERARDRVERRVQIAGRILVELRDLVQQLDAPRRVRRPSDLHFVHADELLEVARLPVERLEDLGDHHLVRLAMRPSRSSAESATAFVASRSSTYR